MKASRSGGKARAECVKVKLNFRCNRHAAAPQRINEKLLAPIKQREIDLATKSAQAAKRPISVVVQYFVISAT